MIFRLLWIWPRKNLESKVSTTQYPDTLYIISLPIFHRNSSSCSILYLPRFGIIAILVNVAVNCAGIAPARKTLSQKVNEDGTVTQRLHSLEEFSKTISVNTVGSFNLARLASGRMASRSLDSDGLRGCIINTASVAAYDGQIGQVAYAASKGGVVGMVRFCVHIMW